MPAIGIAPAAPPGPAAPGRSCPRRMSVRPVASQTRAPLGNGIIARPAPAAPPSPPPDRAAPEIRTRPPSGSSISISPEGAGTASATGGGAAGAISTAAKPGTSLSRRRAPDLGTEPLAPGEELARADAVPSGDTVHRLARRQRLGHQPALVLLRPTPARPPLEDLDPRHALAPRTSLWTPHRLGGAAILPSLGARARRPSPDGYPGLATSGRTSSPGSGSRTC